MRSSTLDLGRSYDFNPLQNCAFWWMDVRWSARQNGIVMMMEQNMELQRENQRAKKEKLGYLMLFCSLIMVRNQKRPMEEIAQFVPLSGKAQLLAQELARE